MESDSEIFDDIPALSDYSVDDIVEVFCCESEDDEDPKWRPAKVISFDMDMLVVTRMTDGENIALINCSLVRFLPLRDGDVIDVQDITPGLVCLVWHFGDEDFRMGAIDGVITDKCAVVSFFHNHSQQEVPFEYLRLSKPTTQNEKHKVFMGEQQLKLDKGLPSTRLKEFMKVFLVTSALTPRTVASQPKKSTLKKKKKKTSNTVERIHSSLEPRRNKTTERAPLHEPRKNRSLPSKDLIQKDPSLPETVQAVDVEQVGIESINKPRVDVDQDTGETIFLLCEALKRLKLNPLIIFNIANKPPKSKYISHEQFIDTVGSLTNIDISKSVKKVIIKVIDPTKNRKLDLKLLKTNLAALMEIGDGFSVAQAVEPAIDTTAVEPVINPRTVKPVSVETVLVEDEVSVFSPRSLLKVEASIEHAEQGQKARLDSLSPSSTKNSNQAESEWKRVDVTPNVKHHEASPVIKSEEIRQPNFETIEIVRNEDVIQNHVIDRPALGLKPHIAKSVECSPQVKLPVQRAHTPQRESHHIQTPESKDEDGLHGPYSIMRNEKEDALCSFDETKCEECNCWLRLQWLLPSHTLLYLADGITAVEGFCKDPAAQDVSNLVDNFVFRNKDVILDSLRVTAGSYDEHSLKSISDVLELLHSLEDTTQKDLARTVLDTVSQNCAERSAHELPIYLIADVLRKLGAPLSVETAPLYLHAYVSDESSGSGDEESARKHVLDFRALIQAISDRHLLDMMSFIEFDQLEKLLDDFLNDKVGKKKEEVNLFELISGLSELLALVAVQHSYVGLPTMLSPLRFKRLQHVSALTQHPRFCAYKSAMCNYLWAWFYEIGATKCVGIDLKGLILSHILAYVQVRASERVMTTTCVSLEQLAKSYTIFSCVPKHIGKLNTPVSFPPEFNVTPNPMSEDRLCDEVEEEGFLQDRMCYFIIGNLHRLRAELKDSSSIESSVERGEVMSVGSMVQTLKGLTACPYPPPALATLISNSVLLANKAFVGREVWDIPVDLSLIEHQLDEYLMTET